MTRRSGLQTYGRIVDIRPRECRIVHRRVFRFSILLNDDSDVCQDKTPVERDGTIDVSGGRDSADFQAEQVAKPVLFPERQIPLDSFRPKLMLAIRIGAIQYQI